MFRFLFIIFLYYILIFQNVFGFIQANNTCPVCDCKCNCIVQIEAVNDDPVEDVGLVQATIDTRTSLSETQATAPSSCLEATAKSCKSGIYKIKLENISVTDLQVFCEEDVDSGGWLVIQRRQSGSMNFTRGWHDYKEGFGDLTGNYWIGLEKLHVLTNSCEQELYIQLERSNSGKYYAKYSKFRIGDESASYVLKSVGDYSGNAGDSLSLQTGYKFSTYDRDNDFWSGSCAELYRSGWWFGSCYRSNLNGYYDGYIHWNDIGSASLSFTQMLIRPTENCVKRLMLSNLKRCV